MIDLDVHSQHSCRAQFSWAPVKEKKRAQVERGAGDVPMELGNEEQVADRHAAASGEEENQHEQNRMRDIRSGKKRIGDSQ